MVVHLVVVHPIQTTTTTSTTVHPPSRIPSFEFVTGRLFFSLGLVTIVYVPSIAYKTTEVGLIVSAALFGLASVLPITVLVSQSVPTARTPWMVGEISSIVAVVLFSILSGLQGTENQWSQLLLILSTTMTLLLPLVIAYRITTTVPDTRMDLRRTRLCIATALWAPLFLISNKLGWTTSVIPRYLAFLSAFFLGASLFLDRNDHFIEFSIPYAASYGWGLATSMVGFQIILKINSPSLLLLNTILSVYTGFIQWCFSQLSGRITTIDDTRSFMFPGFFAIELFHVVLFAKVTNVRLMSWDFVATLALQECQSITKNIGITKILWHRFLRTIGREKAQDHPFGSRRAMKLVLHWAVADSISKLMSTLVVCMVLLIETILSSSYPTSSVTCAVARCQEGMVDLQLIYLYGVVLLVRCIVVVIERLLLLQMMSHYRRRSSLILENDRRESRITIGFKRFRHEVRKLLGGKTSETCNILIIAVFILVMAYTSALRNGF